MWRFRVRATEKRWEDGYPPGALPLGCPSARTAGSRPAPGLQGACACVRACMCACVHVCMRACVQVHGRAPRAARLAFHREGAGRAGERPGTGSLYPCEQQHSVRDLVPGIQSSAAAGCARHARGVSLPEASRELTAVMTLRVTNTRSKVVIVHLQEGRRRG